MEEDQESSSIVVDPNEEPMTDDNFTLSDGATPAQDEPETGISQMDAADIESELNNLLTIDESIQYPPWCRILQQTQKQQSLHPSLTHSRIEIMNEEAVQANQAETKLRNTLITIKT